MTDGAVRVLGGFPPDRSVPDPVPDLLAGAVVGCRVVAGCGGETRPGAWTIGSTGRSAAGSPRATVGTMTGADEQGGVDGQVEGPESGASDNAAENVAPEAAGDVLGAGARDGVSDADRGIDDPSGSERPPVATGERSQPRSGAETPVDAEDLVHAQGQAATPATLARAQQRLDEQGPAAVESVLPDGG